MHNCYIIPISLYLITIYKVKIILESRIKLFKVVLLIELRIKFGDQ